MLNAVYVRETSSNHPLALAPAVATLAEHVNRLPPLLLVVDDLVVVTKAQDGDGLRLREALVVSAELLPQLLQR